MPFCVFVSSPFAFRLLSSTFGARKTRNMLGAITTFNRRRHENIFVENFMSAGRNLSCCRPLFVVSSPRNAKVEVTKIRQVSCCRVFAPKCESRNNDNDIENTKWHKSATINIPYYEYTLIQRHINIDINK